ncbi:LysM peptidoglycan-binding domain-containing protein [Acidithiobacillus sp. AMEEHan]|uniref:LysM peptidoglycan-binding domain-containing protein n=1 Tax=Acidithiobacillus sp. AMEEHan TaxID=2994951 RepID=UPI0027E4AB5C|nr:LysM peptidoglycan-binding domain-containing protein [Acidithiobacillus sp. AMEEHan]
MRKSVIVLSTSCALLASPLAWASNSAATAPANNDPSESLSQLIAKLQSSGPAGQDPSTDAQETAPETVSDSSQLLQEFHNLQHSDVALQNAQESIWTDLVDGFRISDVSRPRVAKWRSWFLQHQGKLEEILHNSRPFLYYVANAVHERGLPMELALLPAIESGYNPKAYSPAAAAGLWQFIPGTARNFGLQNTRWGDPRLSLTASTNAALDYLSYLYNYFGGNWLLAIAAYNAGQGTVSAAIQQNVAAGEPTDFWDLNLPNQTENYVAELLGLAQVIQNAQAYHIALPSIPNTAHIALVNTPRRVNLQVAAQLMDVSVTELQRLNAGLSYGVAPAGYSLVVPKDKAKTLRTALLQMPEMETPTPAPAATPAPAIAVQTARPTPAVHYTSVRPGETLSQLALRTGVSVRDLERWNHLRSGRFLQVGQRLVIYGGKPMAVASGYAPRSITVRPGESLWQLAQRADVSVSALASANDISTRSVIHPGQKLQLPGAHLQEATYTVAQSGGSIRVRPGETLWQIAQRAGVSVAAIASYNGLHSKSILHPGQVLRLPARGTEVAALSPQQERLATAPHATTYVVRPGDTVWQIAEQFHVSPHAVVQWNRLASASDLQPGKHLTIFLR